MFGNYLSTKEVVSIAFFFIAALQVVNMVLTVKLSKNKVEVSNTFTPSSNKNTAVSGDKNSAS